MRWRTGGNKKGRAVYYLSPALHLHACYVKFD